MCVTKVRRRLHLNVAHRMNNSCMSVVTRYAYNVEFTCANLCSHLILGMAHHYNLTEEELQQNDSPKNLSRTGCATGRLAKHVFFLLRGVKGTGFDFVDLKLFHNTSGPSGKNRVGPHGGKAKELVGVMAIVVVPFRNRRCRSYGVQRCR